MLFYLLCYKCAINVIEYDSIFGAKCSYMFFILVSRTSIIKHVTSGGQRSLLKKKLQVCESQQSCLFVGDRILIFHHNLQINSLKILQCDFLDFFSYFVSHSWGIPMMKITGLSHLFKWENLHNWWLTKYFFAPLYIVNPLVIFTFWI